MLHPLYDGLPLVPTRAAMTEMVELGLDEWDIAEILEDGHDCGTGRRKEGTLERCLDRADKTIKAVAVRSHNWSLGCDVWAIIHVGKFKRRR